MKLTDLTDQVRKELDSLESEARNLAESTLGLSQKERLLEADILKKEEYLARLQEKSRAAQEETEAFLGRKADLEKAIAEKARLAEGQTAQKNRKATEEANRKAHEMLLDLEARQNQLEEKESTVLQRVGDLQNRQETLQARERELEEKVVADAAAFLAVTDHQRVRESALDTRSGDLDRRESGISEEESRLLKLKGELLARENGVRKGEEGVLLTRQATEKAQRRAIELSESLERKLAGLEEKEKALRVREIRLADREGIASARP